MTELSRRAFLGAGAAAGAAAVASLSGCSGSSAHPSVAPTSTTTVQSLRLASSARDRVVVVGAGLAGLTASLDLVAAGWQVDLLEARDRVGGRVMTFRDQFSPGLHAEAGGESIDDDHNEIQALVRRFGLKTEKRDPNKYLHGVIFQAGRRTPITAWLALRNGKVGADYSRANDAMSTVAAGVDPDHPERARNAEKLDAQNANDWLTSLELVPEAQFLMAVAMASEYNCVLDQLSMLFVAQQQNASEAMGSGGAETMRIAGGNDQLPKAMARALGARVALDSPVTRVEHSSDGVRVHSGSRVIDAAHLVLALPPPPLRAIDFAPRLPDAVAAMVSGLDLGDAAKVVTEYSSPFWRKEGLSGFSLTDEPFRTSWDATDSYAADHALLTDFITGPFARQELSAATRVSEVEAQTALVYPEGVKLRTGQTATQAWSAEPYTGGGYSLFKPGQVTKFWPVLQAPTASGRIRFAGEHTEALSGYMESAIRSGRRVAAAIGAPPPR